jgi:polysaccharide biosynthesis protein PelG
MAGIGFALKKLFLQQRSLSNVAAYLYSSVIIVGPMLICMSIILLAQTYLGLLGVSFLQKETLTATIVYCFIFSMILSGGLVFVTSRYISDCLFTDMLGDILNSYYIMQAFVSVIASCAAILFFCFSPINFWMKSLSYSLFIILSLIWVDMVYITAFRDYSKIILAFIIGFVIMVGLGMGLVYFTSLSRLNALLLAIMIGFLVLHIFLAINIKSYFVMKDQNKRRLTIISYFKKHYVLLLIGFFLTSAPYVHNFVFWYSSNGVTSADTYRYCPNYDIPSFYAILTVLPSIVMFVVSMETSFYSKYRNYYFLILNEGIIYEIKQAKKEMEDTLFSELAKMMEIQFLVSFVSVIGGIYLLTQSGFSTSFTNCFTSLAMGNFVYIFLNITILILLYFDDKRGALIFTIAFFSLNIIFSIFSIDLGQNSFGYGYFISGFICLTAAMIRLFFFVKNISYITYCKQPLAKNVSDVKIKGN